MSKMLDATVQAVRRISSPAAAQAARRPRPVSRPRVQAGVRAAVRRRVPDRVRAGRHRRRRGALHGPLPDLPGDADERRAPRAASRVDVVVRDFSGRSDDGQRRREGYPAGAGVGRPVPGHRRACASACAHSGASWKSRATRGAGRAWRVSIPGRPEGLAHDPGLIADDQRRRREGLKRIVADSPDMEVAGEPRTATRCWTSRAGTSATWSCWTWRCRARTGSTPSRS